MVHRSGGCEPGDHRAAGAGHDGRNNDCWIAASRIGSGISQLAKGANSSRGVEPELAASSSEGPASHGVTLAGVIFRVAARTKKSYALAVGYVVGEVREVDSRVLPLALLADRTE